jgi:hypothetical protein
MLFAQVLEHLKVLIAINLSARVAFLYNLARLRGGVTGALARKKPIAQRSACFAAASFDCLTVR